MRYSDYDSAREKDMDTEVEEFLDHMDKNQLYNEVHKLRRRAEAAETRARSSEEILQAYIFDYQQEKARADNAEKQVERLAKAFKEALEAIDKHIRWLKGEEA